MSQHGKTREIGATLVRLHYVQPEALGRTQEVLARQLVRGRHLALVAGSGGGRSLEARLTVSESALLLQLMQHPDTVLSCRELARTALGYDVSRREAQEIVRPHIYRLRKKIEPNPGHSRLIRTVPGKGYFFAP